MSYHALVATPLESLSLGLIMDGGSQSLLRVEFVVRGGCSDIRSKAPNLLCAVAALERYFIEPAAATFALPLQPNGTPFQRRVWMALAAIPCGVTVTYGELASELGTSARAVGNACRLNPLPLVVPCHRVVASNGIGGFVGQTDGAYVDFKQWLLEHERSNVAGGLDGCDH